MKEIYFRKFKVTCTTLVIFLCGLGYLWCIFALDLTNMKRLSHIDAVYYSILAVIVFGALLMLVVNGVTIRKFVHGIVLHRPVLILTDGSLHIYDSFCGNYIVLPWSQIEAFEPFDYKGKTTYYVVLRDYDTYYRQLASWLRRYIMWSNSMIIRRSVINIDTPSMDIDADELLGLLNSHLSH